jgi:SAM-dependent methyltransferase
MREAQFHLHFNLEENHWWFMARRHIITGLLKILVQPSAESALLEIGCGSGGNLLGLSPYYRIMGCDISAEAIRLAQQKLPGVDLFVGCGLGEIQEQIRQAKIILLLDVLEHVEDDCGFMGKLLDIMAKGAILAVTVPANRNLWSPHDAAFGHLRRYELSDFKKIVGCQPNQCLLLSYFSSHLYPIIWATRVMNRLRGRASGEAGTDFWMPSALVNKFLYRIFAAELRVLTECLGSDRNAFRFGSSLIGILRS